MIYEGWLVGVASPQAANGKLQAVMMPCMVAGVPEELPSEEKVAEALRTTKTKTFSAFAAPMWVNIAETRRYSAVHTQLFHQAEQFGVNVPKTSKPNIIGCVAGIRNGQISTEDGSETSYVQQRETEAEWLVIEDSRVDADARRKAFAQVGVGLIRQQLADAYTTDEDLRTLAESPLLQFAITEKLATEQWNIVGSFRNVIWELTGKYYSWFTGTIETDKQLSSAQHAAMSDAEAAYYDCRNPDWLKTLQFPAYYRDMLFTADGELEYYQR